MNVKNVIPYASTMLLIVGMMTLLCGCWDNKDINHRALPIVMGIEKSEDDYQVYLLIPMKDQDKNSALVVSDKGTTINEVIDKMNKNLEMQIDLLHLKIIIFDRSIAEKGLNDSLSSFMRAGDVSPKTIVTITEHKLRPLFERMNAASLNNGISLYDYFEKNAGWSPHLAQTRIWHVFRSMQSETKDVPVPLISAGKATALESSGSAVLRKGIMVGKISSDETLMFNAFAGMGSQGKIEVMNQASVLIVSDTLSHSTSLVENTPVLNSKLTLKVTIIETKGSPTATLIQQELEELWTARYIRMFRKVQSNRADILGLGQLFRNKIPMDRLKYWRDDYYPRLKFNFRIHAIIQNEGLLKMKE
ncbi:Ger(x)C family spore germination protein [Cohnella panacarvi]|uniref:Ger(x)C family spore germination protein n=1 Tax=Cohnella panacarvi TaxID=400776 RepID=UPI00047B3342|nr:Ger(x)C family spore germination protein [Cohnella panacarvi]